PHTPEFARYTTLPEALGAVEEAAVGLAGAAADWLADPVLRERAQEEFDARGPAVRWEE
ncbi:MAG: M20 family peptidase, partial [Propionibacterium sp.]|nr:M20 family peptidase [Propionibacterium sp.]